MAPIASANDHTYSLVVREEPADVEVVAEVTIAICYRYPIKFAKLDQELDYLNTGKI